MNDDSLSWKQLKNGGKKMGRPCRREQITFFMWGFDCVWEMHRHSRLYQGTLHCMNSQNNRILWKIAVCIRESYLSIKCKEVLTRIQKEVLGL